MNLEGMDELLSRVEDMGQRVEGDVRTRAIRAGAERLQQAVSEQAPRGTVGNERIADNIIIQERDDRMSVGPSERFHYGFFLEFGTSKMSAQPFLSPAFENNRVLIIQDMGDVLRREFGL
jgi:HK97 gp10 family phage protein